MQQLFEILSVVGNHGCGSGRWKQKRLISDFLWKWKHFDEKDWKQKWTRKWLILSRAGSKKIPKVRKWKRTQKHKTSRGAGSWSIKNLTASTSLLATLAKFLREKGFSKGKSKLSYLGNERSLKAQMWWSWSSNLSKLFKRKPSKYIFDGNVLLICLPQYNCNPLFWNSWHQKKIALKKCK